MKRYLFVQILTLVVGVGFFFRDDSPYWDCLDHLSICQSVAWRTVQCKHHEYHWYCRQIMERYR
jgi:hypothetical protein